MSFTTTTNYELVKPDVGSESNSWGTEYNANMDVIDSTLEALQQQINSLNVQVVFQ